MFSDDGQWWWNGSVWVATSQVAIPDLAIPQPDSLRQSIGNRQRLGETANVTEGVALATQNNPLGFLVGLSFLFAERKAFREFRQWTLEQLAAATTYLLGADEPMVSGETSLFRESGASLGFFYSTQARRDLAVVVTSAHVVLLRFDQFDGQPRSVALAARARDVRVEAPTPIFSARRTIIVRRGGQSWLVQGTPGVMQPAPVVAAWRTATAITGAK